MALDPEIKIIDINVTPLDNNEQTCCIGSTNQRNSTPLIRFDLSIAYIDIFVRDYAIVWFCTQHKNGSVSLVSQRE